VQNYEIFDNFANYFNIIFKALCLKDFSV
jgi:hypothetical protein